MLKDFFKTILSFHATMKDLNLFTNIQKIILSSNLKIVKIINTKLIQKVGLRIHHLSKRTNVKEFSYPLKENIVKLL